MKLSNQVFKPLSSKIDWCEPNYVFTQYIAEFWNTISNLPMLLIPIVMIILYADYSIKVPNCRYVNVIWLLLMMTGIGSIYFHATLSLFGQFLDEMGILWVCSAVGAFWLPDSHIPGCLKHNRFMFKMVVLFLTVVATVLSFVKPEINHWFLFGFTVPAISILISQTKRLKSNQNFQTIAHSGLYCWIFALACWLSDRFLCQFWLNIHFPNLHGFWHIMVAVGSYYACVCYSYCYALQEVPSLKPTLKFKVLCSATHCGFWFVDFTKSSDVYSKV